MPMAAVSTRYGAVPLLALYRTNILVQHVVLPPNVVYARGQVLAPSAAPAANDVQTLTIGGAPTGGTFPISGTNPLTGAAVTTTVTYNPTTLTGAALQPQLASAAMFGPGNVTVAGPAGGPYVITFVGALAATPMALLTTSAAGLTGGTPTATVAHTTTGAAGGTYTATSAGAECLLKYPCATDAQGLITLGSQAGGGEWGQTFMSAPAYFSGTFRTEECTGLDATAVASLGRIISGTIAKGQLMVT